MADFPENEIEILPNFLSDNLNNLWEEMQTALSEADISVTGQVSGPNANLVNQIRGNRHRLGQFLNHKATLTTWGTLGTQFKGRDFVSALEAIVGLTVTSIPRVSTFG